MTTTSLLAMLACSTSTLCFAQEAPAPAQARVAVESQELTEIVVTARKLGETVQDTPATVDIRDGAQIAQRGIVSANELNGFVPGLVQMPGVGGLPATTFRGVGSNSALFGVESSVAMYQDGVFLGRTRDYIVPLYDVDHVEFIKGTQSTLLGKNTTLGAISVVNRTPTSEFGYNLAYKHTFEVPGDRLDAAVNVPLNDTISVRLAGLYSRDDGPVRHLISGNRAPDNETYSARLSLLWRPIDGAEARLSYQYDDRSEKGQGLEVLQDPIGALRLRQQAVGQTVFDTPADRRNTFGSAAFGSAPAGVEAFDDHVANRVNLVTTIALGDYTLTSQTAYVQWHANYLFDADFTRANLVTLQDWQYNRQFSQEVRLSSPADRRLRYLLGVYAFQNTWEFRRQLGFNSPAGLVANQPPASPAQGVMGVLNGSYDNRFKQETKAYSLFASATFDVTDQLNLTVGLRQTWEDKDADFLRTGVGFFGTVATPQIPAASLTREESALDYDVGLQYRPTESVMAYATYSRGSKSGGFQETPTLLVAAPYKGETAKSAEAGVKLDLGPTDASLAVFHTVIDDFQTNFTTVINGVSTSQVGNSKLRTRGAEFSVFARPLDGVSIGGSATYSDAEFRSFLGGTTPANAVVFPGMRAPRAPKFSGEVFATYVRPLGDDLELTLDGRLSHTSKTYLNNLNFSTGDHPPGRAHENLNLRATVGNPEAGWDVSLIGDNLLDQKWATFATRVTADGAPAVPAPALGQRSYYGSLNRPRTIAIQVRLRR